MPSHTVAQGAASLGAKHAEVPRQASVPRTSAGLSGKAEKAVLLELQARREKSKASAVPGGHPLAPPPVKHAAFMSRHAYPGVASLHGAALPMNEHVWLMPHKLKHSGAAAKHSVDAWQE